jgi:hypothetical protein
MNKENYLVVEFLEIVLSVLVLQQVLVLLTEEWQNACLFWSH